MIKVLITKESLACCTHNHSLIQMTYLNCFLLLLVAGAAAGQGGPFKVSTATFSCPELDLTDPFIEVFYPLDSPEQQTPLVSYAHGLNEGGTGPDGLVAKFTGLLSEIASYGFVVAATRSCDQGCEGPDRASLPLSPAGFGNFYFEQYRTIECAKALAGTSPVFNKTDFERVGIAGHSMGGQATMFSGADLEFAPSDYNIKAAVLHNAFGTQAEQLTVPFLAYTGTLDFTARPFMTRLFYDLATVTPRGYVEATAGTHNGLRDGDAMKEVGLFTAAFLKVQVSGERVSEAGFDYYAHIFGDEAGSLCNGGHGAMRRCEFEL